MLRISTNESFNVAIMSTNLDIAKCCKFVKELALQAGKIIKSAFESEKIVYNKGEDWNFATDVDQKVEKILIDSLAKEFPDHKIIAEETVDALQEKPKLTDEPTWFVDPIDGTLNFIHALPQFCISIGLVVRKEPVLGVIYNPVTAEMYSAIKGGGAFLNGKRIYTSKVTELKKALLLFEPPVIKNLINKDQFCDITYDLLEATQIARTLGTAAMSMAYVARGAADCMYIDGLAPWDIAAGLVIVSEAGGTVMETKGGFYDIMKPNTIAASNETMARAISKIIVETELKIKKRQLENRAQCKKDTNQVK